MNRARYAALAAACALPVITLAAASSNGVGKLVLAVVVVGGLIGGYAIVAVPDRKRAALATPTDVFRGSALLHARILRRTDRFRSGELKKARTWLLITGDATGDLCVGEEGISWLPNANARRKKIPEIHIGWDQVKVIRIITMPGIREPASVVVKLTDDTPVPFTINRYSELRGGLAKLNYAKWEMVGG